MIKLNKIPTALALIALAWLPIYIYREELGFLLEGAGMSWLTVILGIVAIIVLLLIVGFAVWLGKKGHGWAAMSIVLFGLLGAFVLSSDGAQRFVSAAYNKTDKKFADLSNKMQAEDPCPATPTYSEGVDRSISSISEPILVKRMQWSKWQDMPQDTDLVLRYPWTTVGLCVAYLQKNGRIGRVHRAVNKTTPDIPSAIAYSYASPDAEELKLVLKVYPSK